MFCQSNDLRSEVSIRSWTRVLAFVAIVFSLASGIRAQERDSVPSPPGEVPESLPAAGDPADASSEEKYVPSEEELAEFERRVQVFRDEAKSLAENLAAQRAIYIRFCNEEDQTPRAREEYRAARILVREAMDRTYKAALNVTEMGYEKESLTFIATMIEHRHSIGLYDLPTLLGATAMINGGSKLPYMFEAAARSAIVLGQFDMARELYAAMKVDQAEGLDTVLASRIDAFEYEMKAEAEIRNKEQEEDRLPRVKLETTQGDIVIELFIDQAPSTVSHFLTVVESGFYDDLEFVQVIDHLLALTGDPTDSGKEAPNRFLMDENRRQDARYVFRGSVIMAKASTGEENQYVPNSANTEFAILLMPIRSFAKDHTVFGRVIQGMDVVSRLRRVDPTKEKKDNQIVLPPDRIIKATVTRYPDRMPKPEYFVPPTTR